MRPSLPPPVRFAYLRLQDYANSHLALTFGSHIDFKKLNIKLFLKNRAVDPHSLIAEPDPAVLLLLNADPDQLY